MKFRNPWVDPRVDRIRPEQVQAYLRARGWKELGPADDPHLLRYERTDGGEDGPTLFVPRKVDDGAGTQWMIELLEELARFEDRWAAEVVGDVLQSAGVRVTPANGPNGPQVTDAPIDEAAPTPRSDRGRA